MKKLAATIAFAPIAAALALFLIAGAALIHAAPQPVISDAKNIRYLFTLAAKSGSSAGDTLTLNDVPLVVYFADRPVREAGHMDLASFLKLWDQGVDNFKVDPPNAELAIYQENGDKHAVLIVSKPAVDGDRITFKIDVIGEKLPASFGHATLFIDGLGMTFPSGQN